MILLAKPKDKLRIILFLLIAFAIGIIPASVILLSIEQLRLKLKWKFIYNLNSI